MARAQFVRVISPMLGCAVAVFFSVGISTKRRRTIGGYGVACSARISPGSGCRARGLPARRLKSSILAAGMVACALVLPGCKGVQEIHDWCPVEVEPNPEDCPPCTADDQCVIRSNSCDPEGVCVHEDVEVFITGQACPFGYLVPDDDICRCIEGRCHVDD